MKSSLFNKGLSVVEIIVAIAIIVTVITSVGAALQFYFSFTKNNSENSMATLLIEEGAEAMLLLRDLGWEQNISGLEPETTYYLYYNGDTYKTTTTPTVVKEHFYQTVTVSPVKRNHMDSISDSGTTDPNTLIATITVSRSTDQHELSSASMLLHNAYEN